MVLNLYYVLFGLYALAVAIAIVSFIGRKAPSGDASVGWAWGLIYTAGLTLILVLAFFLRHFPGIGLAVLGLPLVFFALPSWRRFKTWWYVRFPAYADTPPLILTVRNNTGKLLHVQVDCCFPGSRAHTAVIYTSFDYYLEPHAQTAYPLTPLQTRLLAHKSKYVGIQIFERIKHKYEDGEYITDVQPCMKCYEENIETFRSGAYTILIEPE